MAIPANPRTVKVDRPRAVERTDGDTIVSRHFDDGSLRITVYDQHGGARIVTHRKNPSTGADEKTTQNNDGSIIKESTLPDGSSSLLVISPSGAEERTVVSKDASGSQTTRTTFADGSVQTEVTSPTQNGSRGVRTNPDGTQLITETTLTTQQSGDALTSTIISDGTGKILNSQTTLQRPDGSEEITNLADGKPTSIIQRITLPDGATRERVHDFEKNTIETTVTRAYTKDGNTIREVLGENDVKITTTRPDGSTSNVTKFDDGTQEATDFVVRPDGSRVFTTTNRDGSFETVEHLAAKPGEPLRVVTTSSDGTRTEQTLDDERMNTTIRNPDGTRSEIRRDMDGVGSRAEFDAQGNRTALTTIDGEPVEPFPGFEPEPTPAPTPGPTPGPSPAPEPAPDRDADRTREEEQLGDGQPADAVTARTPLEEQRTSDGQLADVLTADAGATAAPVATTQDVDPITGEPLPPDIAGRGIALEPEVAARIEAEQAAAARVGAQPAQFEDAIVASDSPGIPFDPTPAEILDVTATQLDTVPEEMPEPEPEPIEPEPVPEPGEAQF